MLPFRNQIQNHIYLNSLLINMIVKTELFDLNYELLFIKGIDDQEEEKRIAKELLYFLDNYELDNELILEQIEKEDWYNLKYKKEIGDLTDKEKEDVLDTHVDFIVSSCDNLLNCKK